MATPDPVIELDASRAGEERFRLLVESVRDYAIFLLDPSGRVRTWNVGAERINGYTMREIVGRHFSVFYPEEDVRAGKTDMELEVAAREGRFEDEGWRVRKDGSRFWSNVVITALRDERGELVGFAKVTRDLTERRRAEEDRVRLAHAEEALRLRDEFLSIASHELKTPLTALQLLLGDLARTPGLEEKLQRKVARAARSGARLTKLVETLLDVSRIATGKLQIQPAPGDLSVAARELVESMQEAAQQHGCALTFQGPASAPATFDRLRVEQALGNLVSNALRYCDGSPVEVALDPREGEVRIWVRDRGPGIPAHERDRIWQRFERASSMRHYGGLGLGLYLTREIARAHGGDAGVEDRPGGGASFFVAIPR